MRMIRRFFSLSFFVLLSLSIKSQEIELYNPSWEGPTHMGSNISRIIGWNDCGAPGETPPDIHGIGTYFFNVTQRPFDGSTFLGMVVRSTDTWEMVSQRLNASLIADQCYAFSVHLSRSARYRSGIKGIQDSQFSFTKPIVLRIYGSNLSCASDDVHRELLAESPAISNTNWQRYDFKFHPTRSYRFIMFEAYYKTPTLFAYNGNILLDNASNIIPIDCDDDPVAALDDFEESKNEDLAELLVKIENLNKKPHVKEKNRPPVKNATTKKKASKKQPEKTQKNITVKKQVPRSKKIKPSKQIVRNKKFNIDDLNKPLKEKQIIRLKNFYFDADNATIKEASKEVLNDLFDFLDDNPDIVIEIGGHTNSLPNKHAYCDKLSLDRAKAVREYLIDKGISPHRLLFKGYGKRRPIASDATLEGQRKNQRVEIKILSLFND